MLFNLQFFLLWCASSSVLQQASLIGCTSSLVEVSGDGFILQAPRAKRISRPAADNLSGFLTVILPRRNPLVGVRICVATVFKESNQTREWSRPIHPTYYLIPEQSSDSSTCLSAVHGLLFLACRFATVNCASQTPVPRPPTLHSDCRWDIREEISEHFR